MKKTQAAREKKITGERRFLQHYYIDMQQDSAFSLVFLQDSIFTKSLFYMVQNEVWQRIITLQTTDLCISHEPCAFRISTTSIFGILPMHPLH